MLNHFRRKSKSSKTKKQFSQGKKCVRFVPTEVSEIHDTIARSDMTESERKNYWYDNEFYYQNHTSIRKIVTQMETGVSLESDDDCLNPDETEQFCSRGLEPQTKYGAFSRQRNIAQARAAVLNEYDRQCSMHISDQVALANVYAETSMECAKCAFEIGLQDQRVVERFLLEQQMHSISRRHQLARISRKSSRRLLNERSPSKSRILESNNDMQAQLFARLSFV